MRILFFLILFLLPATSMLFTLARTTDSIQTAVITTDSINNIESEQYQYAMEDDFAPGLAFFALIAFAFMFIFTGAGIVIAVIALLILFGLIGTGILSASILVGLYNKSFTKGFKTFLVALTTIGGLIISSTGLWLLNKLVVHWFSSQTAIFIGSLVGLTAGWILGTLLFLIIQKLTAFLKAKINAG